MFVALRKVCSRQTRRFLPFTTTTFIIYLAVQFSHFLSTDTREVRETGKMLSIYANSCLMTWFFFDKDHHTIIISPHGNCDPFNFNVWGLIMASLSRSFLVFPICIRFHYHCIQLIFSTHFHNTPPSSAVFTLIFTHGNGNASRKISSENPTPKPVNVRECAIQQKYFYHHIRIRGWWYWRRRHRNKNAFCAREQQQKQHLLNPWERRKK